MSDKQPHGPSELDARAATVLLGCCLIWGVGLVMVKLANAGISPVLNAALRSAVAGVVLLLWAWLRGIALFSRDGTLSAGIVCAIFFALEFIALYLGLAETPAARGTIFLQVGIPFTDLIGRAPRRPWTVIRIGTHQGGVQRRHLDYYLDEFTFRFNRRRSNARGLLFHRLAEQAAAIAPAPYRAIIAKRAEPGTFDDSGQ